MISVVSLISSKTRKNGITGISTDPVKNTGESAQRANEQGHNQGMKFSQVLTIRKGTKIGSYIVKGPGESRGESALVYLIRNNAGGKPNQKRIRESEWKAAVQHLKAHGSFRPRLIPKNDARCC